VKLLFVVHQFFPECHSGTEQYCRAVAREATRRGDEVVILSLDPWLDREAPLLRVVDEPYEGLAVPRLRHWWGLSANDVLLDYHNPIVARRFAQLLDAERPDAVHFFHLRRLGADLIDVAKDRGLRTVVNLMDFWFLCPRFTLLRRDGGLCEGPPDGGLGCLDCEFPDLAAAIAPARREAAALARGLGRPPHRAGPAARAVAVVRRRDELLARLGRADAIVAPSRFLAGMFVDNGLPAERLHVVPYGLEPGRVRRLPVERPRSPLRVAFAGVLSPWKAPDLLVRAALAVEGPLEVTIHGRTAEPMFQEYIDRTRALAADDPRIRFPGPFGHGDLDAVMAATDLLVVPSIWYENTPFVVLEAFEAGVPVAVSALGGMTELVEPGVNGFHFPAGDAEALAELLRTLLREPGRLRALDPRPVGRIADDYRAFAPLYRGG
jgi:glycosyltransferase involved in cell wall biosynthesis